MKISLAPLAAVAPLTLALLAGCNGLARTPGVVPNDAQQAIAASHLPAPSTSMIALTTADHIAPTVHPNTGSSWMKSAAKNTKYLLYVSDEATGTVNVYAYKAKAGHLLGQLTGFQFPYGECIDSSGNVYVTDFGAADIVEYAHGGTTPINTLTDGYGYPIGCSVDPTTGNLAVANFEGIGSTCMGGIVIYENATGSGTLYQDKDFNFYWPPGYDSKGNLYVQGEVKYGHGKSGLAGIAAGGSQLTTISLSGGKIFFPGGVQWDGQYVTATDQRYKGSRISGVYRMTVSSSSATIVSSTQLSDDECLKGKVVHSDVVQPFINGTARPDHAVVAGNLSCTYRYDFWNYIKGGNPKRTLPYDLAPELASGQTVSPKKV